MFSGESETLHFGVHFPPQGRPIEPTPSTETRRGWLRWLTPKKNTKQTVRSGSQQDERVIAQVKHPVRPPSTTIPAAHYTPRRHQTPEAPPPVPYSAFYQNNQRSDQENEKANVIDIHPESPQDVQPRIRTTTTRPNLRTYQTPEATAFNEEPFPSLDDSDDEQDVDVTSLDVLDSIVSSNIVRSGEPTDDWSCANDQVDKRRSGKVKKWLKNATPNSAQAFSKKLILRSNKIIGNSLATGRESPFQTKEQASSNIGRPQSARDERVSTRVEPTSNKGRPSRPGRSPPRSRDQHSSSVAGPFNPRGLTLNRSPSPRVSNAPFTGTKERNSKTRKPAPRGYVHPYVTDPSVITEDDRQIRTGSWLM